MKETTAVLGNFQINLPGPNNAGLSISGYMYADESLESLNERMDVCREALLRQQAILEVPVLEKEIEMYEKLLSDSRAAYANLLDRANKKQKLSSQDESAMRNYPIQIKDIEKRLEAGQSKISKARNGVLKAA